MISYLQRGKLKFKQRKLQIKQRFKVKPKRIIAYSTLFNCADQKFYCKLPSYVVKPILQGFILVPTSLMNIDVGCEFLSNAVPTRK